MPTIQVRTDDQTKIDSTAIFDKLGITMSEAINLFLVFILRRKDGKLFVKDCNLAGIPETLGSF